MTPPTLAHSARPVPLNLSPVAQTLLVPLWARAQESLRADPVLYDPSALEVANALDFDFSLLRRARATQLGCCVRGALVDTWVRRFLRRHPEGTVVELGAGLNDRFRRVDNGRMNWVSVELPEVAELRRRFFPDKPRRRLVAASALQSDWIDAARETGRGPVFVASEGVLVYWTQTEVQRLFRMIAQGLPGARLAFDAMTPLVLRHQGHHDAMRHFSAQFTWALRKPTDVESWARGVSVRVSRSFPRMIFARSRRLPRLLRWFGPGLGFVYRPLFGAYTINLVDFAATGSRC